MRRPRYLATACLLALVALPLASQAEHYAMQEQSSFQGTPYFSGGFGVEQREHLMTAVADDYNVKLEFALDEGNYLGDVRVEITDGDGARVMEALSKGPWFFTRLPPGRYRVEVSGYGQAFADSVSVPASGLAQVVFNDWDKERVIRYAPRTP
jgi:hypothetical protein